MFKRALSFSLLSLLAAVGGLAYYFLNGTEADRENYAQLKSLTQITPQDGDQSQNKQAVRKEIWTEKGGDRLHTTIWSDTSRMTLAQGSGKNELSEEMRQVIALMQEELLPDAQRVRALKAEQATYYFKDDRLVAEKVKLYRYQLPGRALPPHLPDALPLMEGEASWAEIYLKEGRIDLNASQVILRSLEKNITASAQSLLFDGRLALLEGEVRLDHPLGQATSEAAELIYGQEQNKGTLTEAKLLRQVVFTRPDGSKLECQKADFSLKEIRCAGPSVLSHADSAQKKSYKIETPGEIVVDHEAKITTLNRSEEAQVHYTDLFGEMFADKVTIAYEQGEKGLKVKSIVMEGKVFMAHSLPSEVERSYAYADRAEYFPETFEMVLEGDRVLVFDKINQVEVSAPRIRVRRDQATKKETIKGEGDVRFTLDEKEFQALKNRFKLEEKRP